MLDNVKVAILSLVNELANRHGMEPIEFIATIADYDGKTHLRYETVPQGNSGVGFQRMLESLGLSIDHSEIAGSEQEIWRTLQMAIQRAPRSHLGRA